MKAAHPFAGCERDRGSQCKGYRPDVGVHNSVGCLWFDVEGDEVASGVVA